MKNFTLFSIVLLLGMSAKAQKSTIPTNSFSEKDKNLIASVLEIQSPVSKKDKEKNYCFKDMAIDLDSTYYDVESPAMFSEGMDGLNKFVFQNLVRPNESKGETVLVRFKVERFGEISKIHVIDNGVSPKLSAEAINLVKKMKTWIPAKIQGIPVASFYVLPIKF